MSDKKIRIKVSDLRKLIREAMGSDGSTIASRQTMIQLGDDKAEKDPKDKEPLLDGDVGNPEARKNWFKDTHSNERKDGVAVSDELDESVSLEEFKSFDDDFAEKIHDKQYEAMAKQIFDAWNSRDMDVNWAGVVDIFARNHSKNLGQRIDKTKLYEKVLDIVEKAHEPMYTVEDEAWK